MSVSTIARGDVTRERVAEVLRQAFGPAVFRRWW
jgi:hypothetical protein